MLVMQQSDHEARALHNASTTQKPSQPTTSPSAVLIVVGVQHIQLAPQVVAVAPPAGRSATPQQLGQQCGAVGCHWQVVAGADSGQQQIVTVPTLAPRLMVGVGGLVVVWWVGGLVVVWCTGGCSLFKADDMQSMQPWALPTTQAHSAQPMLTLSTPC